MFNLIAGVFTAFSMLMHGVIGGHATTTPAMMPRMASSTTSAMGHMPMKGNHMMASSTMGMMHAHGLLGTVTAVNGMTLTVLGKSTLHTATSTYSVDATNAKVFKGKVGATTVSTVAVGDFVAVQGAVSGSTVTATVILDGNAPSNHPMLERVEGRQRMGSSTVPQQ